VTPSSANLMVTKTDNTTNEMAIPGKAIIYTITVTNVGSDDLTGATIADPFPTTLNGVTFTASQTGGASGFTANGTGNISDTVEMPIGSSITYTATGTIASSATGTLVNVASATDPDGNNSTATDTVTLTPMADLQITKTAPPAVFAATNFIIPLVVTNAGPSDAQSVTLSDLLPTGETLVFQFQSAGTDMFILGSTGNQITDTISTLPAGASATISVIVMAEKSAVGTTVMNTATISSTTPDPTPGNNSSTATTMIQAPVISITANLPAGKVGVSYSETFTTTGGTAPYSFNVTGNLPLGLAFKVTSGVLGLSGIPRQPGTFHFTVKVTDTNGFTDSQPFTLTIQQGNVAVIFFLTQPGPGAVNGFLPTFLVGAADKFGNRLTGVTVTLHLVPITTAGPASFIKGSVLQATTVNGIATFSHVGINTRGAFRLLATVPGLFTYSGTFAVGLFGRHSPFPF
jgi:uncharacterized repeat protein (TIGR01451 family)